jgi:hypothetical protein
MVDPAALAGLFAFMGGSWWAQNSEIERKNGARRA